MANGGAAILFLAMGVGSILAGRRLKSTIMYMCGALMCCLCVAQLYIAHHMIESLSRPSR